MASNAGTSWGGADTDDACVISTQPQLPYPRSRSQVLGEILRRVSGSENSDRRSQGILLFGQLRVGERLVGSRPRGDLGEEVGMHVVDEEFRIDD